ncbi:hypothetical protein ASZ78_010715 [Callipepla squamata]|uniref:Calponin-homology (CH) domain-containing protein n=1 Tax=Callipepla squamata TaxID=9009 RepID=A0A226NIB0_CALSU|nr:hypothetical protein ASZ78_010715 [Callipepla squamata]
MARVVPAEEGAAAPHGEFGDIIKSRSGYPETICLTEELPHGSFSSALFGDEAVWLLLLFCFHLTLWPDEHNDVQKKTFTKWINARFSKSGTPPVKDMFTDLKDGRKLLDLLEGLTGKPLVELVNIGGTDIVDGNHKLTLGLLWSIILHWQVKDVMKNIMSDLQQTNSEKILLSWVRQSSRPYSQVNVLNFTTSWADGLAFNAVIHRHKPELFSWDKVITMSPVERLEHAFSLAKNHLGIEKLLDPEDVAVPLPDKKSIIMYLTSLFEVLPKQVTMEDIREVETLPRRFKQECEDGEFNLKQAVALDEEQSSSRAETPSTVTEVDMDLDSYQVALEEVLTWLLSAEDAFREQEEISGDVEEVKEQFSTHEAFMMELTAHQSSVGSVLQAGNQLVAQGNLSPEEEFEIQEQMLLLNSRWEELRVESMDRQSRLHDMLMELQKKQLQQLSDWLTVTEERIQKMESQLLADDLEGLQKQLEEHKSLQSDLEAEQVKVNSLTHMVVIVDESSGESATAILEEQLQCLLKAWLTEKEDALSKVQTSNFRDQIDLSVNVRKLAILKEDMGMKRQTLDQLNELGQDVAQILGSSRASNQIDHDQEELTQRWDSLVQKLEDYSNQVTQAVGSVGISQMSQKTSAETASLKEKVVVKESRQESPPPPPPKKRQIPVDSEAKRKFDAESAELLSWISKSKAAIQATDIKEYKKMRETSSVKEKLKVIEKEKVEKSQKLDDVKRSGHILLDQMGKEGLPAVDLKNVMEKVLSGWKEVVQHLEELTKKIKYQEDINAYFKEMNELEKIIVEKEGWLKNDSSASQPPAVLKDLCQRELTYLVSLSPRLEHLKATCKGLTSQPTPPNFIQESLNGFLDRFKLTCQKLEERHRQLKEETESLPSQDFLGSLQRLKDVLSEVECKQQAIASGLSDPSKVEKALQQTKTVCETLEAQKPKVDKLAEETKALEKQSSDRTKVYTQQFRHVQGHWDKLRLKTSKDVKLLEEITSKLRLFETNSKIVQKWMDGVKGFLLTEKAAQGDAEGLQRQLDQCTIFVNEMEKIEPSLKEMKELESALRSQSIAGINTWAKSRLVECQTQWEKLSKQIISQKNRLSESQEKAVNLKKDLAEMQEWMTQAEEEYLEKDFEYKSPEELENAVEEMKRAKEDVLQKEVRVKILKDNIKMLATKVPSGGQELATELNVVLENYQLLCNRIRGKCHTLEEVWSCWIELLQYLDLETAWLNTLEERVQMTENLSDKLDVINDALESLESILRHPADNRTQIRELGQTLIDGGILDDIISEKLEAFNARYEELSHLAVNRQIALEQQLQTMRETDHMLQVLQENLAELDRQLTSYLTDRVDAFQMPQEAQKIQAEIAAHEATLEELKKSPRSFPPASPECRSPRGGTQLDVLQRKLREVSTKYQLFQKPANFEQRMLDCKRVLESVKAELHVLDVKDTDPDIIQSHLDKCMKLYKTLSEVKLEIETVIKTGRQIVQKQQTDNPKGMDEQLTALKFLYNDLGAQVTEGKQDLERASQVARKMRKESASLSEWLATTESELVQKSTSESLLSDLDSEIAWAKNVLRELERRKADLKSITESCTTLQALVEGSETSLEEKLCVLNAGWSRVRTWTEDWCDTLLNHQSQLEIFDENVAHISTWLYQAEALLDEIEPASKKEETVKRLTSELDDVSLRVDNVRDQAVILMNGRGVSCRELVEPKLAELNRNFEKVSQHIKSAKMLVGQDRLPVMSEPHEVRVAFPDLEKFESDLQNMLKLVEKHQELSEEDEKLDQERAQIEEVLQRGGQLLQQPMEDNKREKIRMQLVLLQTKYNNVQEGRSFQRRQVVELSPVFSQYKKDHDNLMKWLDEAERRLPGLQGMEDEQKLQALAVQQRLKSHFAAGVRTLPFSAEYMVEINKVLLAMADVELLLNAPELNTGIYEDFSTQEDALKNVKDILDKLGEQIAVIHEKQPDVILEATGPEAIQIGDALTQLNAEWDRINRTYNDRKCSFDRAIEAWRQFHCDLNDLSQWITEAEGLLADTRGPDDSLDLQTAGLHQQVLTEEMEVQGDKLEWLNRTEPEVILDKNVDIQEKNKLSDSLQSLNVRWKKTQHTLELSAPADLDKTTTELAEWLVLINQMLKSSIVTVGNAEEINRTIARMKITKADLDQRHPQLDSVFMLAQNLKNKTSSSDIRTVITEKLERVKNQWDNTQHGLEVRQQQLKYMLSDSIQWDEQRKEMEHLMEQCEIRLRMLQQAPKEMLVKQISDNKLLVHDLHRGDITVAAFNDLSNKLLREYRDDDTRRVKETTDQMNTCWVNLNERAVDRQNILETELKTVQVSCKDLESFLKWLQEAETTINVLADASRRENTAQDSASVRELRKQMQSVYQT